MTSPFTAEAVLAGREPVVAQTYARLISRLRAIGDVGIDPKKTSIHLTAGSDGTAFAGVQARKSAILLTIKSAAPIESPRIRKLDQASKTRFHNELLLESPADVDAELLQWLGAAYKLSGVPKDRVSGHPKRLSAHDGQD